MKRIYVLFDLVAEAVSSGLFLYPGDPAAVRAFGDALSDPQSPYSKHAEDFELRCIGLLSDAGVVSGVDHEIPRTVLSGSQWLAAQPKAGPDGQLSLLKEA